MPSIKTAVSLPAPLFKKAEKMARELSISRSELFALAVEDYLKQHENRQILKRIDLACDGQDGQDETYRARAKRSHRRTVEGEW